MKTKDSNFQQSTYRSYGEQEQRDGATRQMPRPEKISPGRHRRDASAAPPGSYGTGSQNRTPPSQISPATNSVGTDGDWVTKVRLQGVGIKTDYTVKEVLTIAGDGLSKPLTGFLEYMGNAGSLLIDGRPATRQQKETIRAFTEKFDAVAGVAGAGNIQAVGKILHHINDAANGKMPSRDEMVANLMEGVSMVDVVIPGLKAKVPPRPDAPSSSEDGSQTGQTGQTGPASAKQETPPTILKELMKQGPLGLMPAANRQEDQKRIDRFSGPVSFYRKDRDVPNPDAASVLHATDYKDRLGVLNVGKGKDLTSYDPTMKAALNRNRSTDISPALANANVIQLGSGNDGVAAVNVCFADLAPGSTTVVTSGPMRGDMALFTADDTGFSAYRAQASKKTPAKSADAAAASIANAHEHFGQTDAYPTKPQNGFDEMFRAARSHPFSALVYSVDDPTSGQPHPKYGPSNDAGLGPDGKLWSAVNFNYLAPNRNSREVGTAEAVITKDLKGKVTVQVLAERGKLENAVRAPDASFTYRQIESAIGSYTAREAV